MVFNTSWKIRLKIERFLIMPYLFVYFYTNGLLFKNSWKIYGVPIIQKHRKSKMLIGDKLELRSSPISNPLAPNHPVVLATRSENAILTLGESVGMTGGTICASERIEIGNRVLIGANCIIIDSDFHPLDPEIRKGNSKKAATAPVFIEDDVFIGMNSIILKGVRIGRGSVIGAGSVVTHNVPEGVICCGNPAKIINKRISESK